MKSGSTLIGDNFYAGGWIDPMPCGDLVIGKHVVLGANARIIRHGPIRPFEHDHIHIGDFCYIGDGARILLGAEIGKGCVVGALSVVARAFPPYSIIAGNPACVVRKRDAYEMLRTFVLKYRDPDPQGLGAKEPEWALLTKDDAIYLLTDPPYDELCVSPDWGIYKMSVNEIVEFYRTRYESDLAARHNRQHKEETC